MTFFLPDYKPDAAPVAEGPDMQPVGFFEGLGPATRSAFRDSNWAGRHERWVANERRDTLARPAAEMIGIDEINRYYDAQFAYDGELRPSTQTIDEFFTLFGTKASDVVLQLAREKAAQDPEAWKGIDLSDEAVEARVLEMEMSEQDEDRTIRSMMPRFGALADLTGGMVASVTDPRTAWAMLLGGGGGSLIKIMGREAALNAGAEVTVYSDRVATAKRLGNEEAGLFETLATAAVGGAAFSGLTTTAWRGAKRAIEYIRLRRTSVPETPAIQAATDAAEAAFIHGEDPFRAAQEILSREPPKTEPLVPQEPLAPEVPSGPPPSSSPLQPDTIAGPLPEDAVLSDILPDMPKPEGTRPRSLGQFIIDKGGIWKGSDRGDLAAIDYRRPGFLKKDKRITSSAGDNGGGMTISEMREAARDNGYVPHDATDSDFIDLIRSDVRKEKRVYSQQDHAAAMEWDAWDNRKVGRRSTAIDDFKDAAPTERGFFVDVDLNDLWNDFGWRDRLVSDFDDWVVERGYNLTPRERGEILTQLQKSGGDAEYLVERVFVRSVDEIEARWGSDGKSTESREGWPPVDDAQGYGAPATGRSDGAGGSASGEPGSSGSGSQKASAGAGRLSGSAIPRLEALQQEVADGRLSPFDDIESPEAQAFADAEIAGIRERMADPEAERVDGVQDMLDEIDENETLLREYEACMRGGDGEGMSGQ